MYSHVLAFVTLTAQGSVAVPPQYQCSAPPQCCEDQAARPAVKWDKSGKWWWDDKQQVWWGRDNAKRLWFCYRGGNPTLYHGGPCGISGCGCGCLQGGPCPCLNPAPAPALQFAPAPMPFFGGGFGGGGGGRGGC